ncbi:hypothetical protein WICPIJ_006112, partial [Wickerhamomyces pijperi]
TGFTSSLMTTSGQENKDIKIPSIRLSFITARDQERFEHAFRMHVPQGENSIDGQTAKQLMMKSGLNATKLADIWALSDLSRSGRLLFPEFALALHLCNIAAKGQPIPYELPLKMKNEVSSFVDAISMAVPDTQSTQAPSQGLFSQPTGFQNFSQLQSQATGFGGAQNGFQSQPPPSTFGM